MHDLSPLSAPRNRPWCAVARLGSIGDNLIVSSVLPLLAEDYNVEVICQEPTHVIFENNPYIAKLTVKKEGDIPGSMDDWGKWLDWFRTRAKEYHKFYHLSHSCEVSLAVGKGQLAWDWVDRVRRQWCGKSYLEFTHDLCEVPYEFNPRFYPTNEEKQQAAETKAKVGRKVVGVTISGSRVDKIWPAMPMAVARIIRELNAPVILFGGPGKDYDLALQIKEQVERQNGSLDGLHLAITPSQEVMSFTPGAPGEKLKLEGPKAPLWPIRRSLSQIQTCDLVLTVDSGLGWGVAMEAMPKIMLLSHASPENITKHWQNTTTLHADVARVPCWSCHKLHDTIDTCTPNRMNTGAACISDISIETVLHAVKLGMSQLKDYQNLGVKRDSVASDTILLETPADTDIKLND